VSIQAQVINHLFDMQKQLGMAYLFISHNLSVVKHICRRIGVMYLGKVVELAQADALYETPLHPYTQALISAIPVIGENAQARIVLSGDLPSPTAPPSGCAFHTRCPYAQEVCKASAPALTQQAPGHYAACHFAGKG
jgi:peptide/nickel transport system ATP-binding protein/oligopeptide transport system ATP-binding protein